MAIQTYTNLRTRAQEIKNEITEGANTALRVGSLLEDKVDTEEAFENNIAEPDLDQFIEVGGRYRISKLHVTPAFAIVDFTTWGKIGATNSPVYNNAITFNEASIIEANADQLKTWVIIGSFNAVPAIISSPPAFLNITGTILTGYANLNRLVFELVMIDAVPKVNLVITQWAGANADPEPPIVIDPQLIAFYEFEEATEINILLDSSSYNNLATNAAESRSSRIAGIVGNAIQSESSVADSIFIATHDASMNFDDGITIAGWFNFPNTTSTIGLMQKNFVTSVSGFQFYRNSDGKIRFELGAITSSRISSVYDTIIDTWVHIAVTHDKTIGRMYINGVENATKAHIGDILANTGDLTVLGTLTIPAKIGTKADQLRLYGRPLTAQEILDIYNAEL